MITICKYFHETASSQLIYILWKKSIVHIFYLFGNATVCWMTRRGSAGSTAKNTNFHVCMQHRLLTNLLPPPSATSLPRVYAATAPSAVGS